MKISSNKVRNAIQSLIIKNIFNTFENERNKNTKTRNHLLASYFLSNAHVKVWQHRLNKLHKNIFKDTQFSVRSHERRYYKEEEEEEISFNQRGRT